MFISDINCNKYVASVWFLIEKIHIFYVRNSFKKPTKRKKSQHVQEEKVKKVTAQSKRKKEENKAKRSENLL